MKLAELRAKKAQLLDQANAHLEKNEIEKFNEVLAEIETINQSIEAHEKLRDQMAQTTKPLPEPDVPKDEGAKDDVSASKEYARAFFSAICEGETVKNARKQERYTVLFNAMTEGVDEKGGFLVPEDISHKINELRRSFTDLAKFVTLESVNTISGTRVREKAVNSAKFAKVSELGTIPDIAEPQFETVSYKVEKYAGILPVSDELLVDNVAGLAAYITRWFARMGVNTDNDNILALLKSLTAITYDITKGVGPLKAVLNKQLDPMISVRAKILTNQSGLDVLDQMQDSTGRGLLQPDPANATAYRVLGRQVEVVSDALMPNGTGAGRPAPMYVGDFKQFATIFRRKGLEMASTNIGAGTFETDSTKFRGIMRADYKSFEKEAVVRLSVPTVTD